MDVLVVSVYRWLWAIIICKRVLKKFGNTKGGQTLQYKGGQTLQYKGGQTLQYKEGQTLQYKGGQTLQCK